MKLNNLEWKIIEVNVLNRNLIVSEKACFGVTNYDEKTIYLDETMKDDRKEQVLRHELTHAVIHSYLIENKENYSEENVCDFVAQYGNLICKLAKEYMEGKCK